MPMSVYSINFIMSNLTVFSPVVYGRYFFLKSELRQSYMKHANLSHLRLYLNEFTVNCTIM